MSQSHCFTPCSRDREAVQRCSFMRCNVVAKTQPPHLSSVRRRSGTWRRDNGSLVCLEAREEWLACSQREGRPVTARWDDFPSHPWPSRPQGWDRLWGEQKKKEKKVSPACWPPTSVHITCWLGEIHIGPRPMPGRLSLHDSKTRLALE